MSEGLREEYASRPLCSVRYYTQAARCGDVAGVCLESSPAREGRRRAKNEECSQEGGELSTQAGGCDNSHPCSVRQITLWTRFLVVTGWAQ